MREIRSTRRLQLVHSDVCSSMQTESIGGAKYFVTFIDEYPRYCAMYFKRHKSEVLDKFKEFKAITTNDVGKARSMIAHAQLLNICWAKAISTAAYRM